MECYILMAEIKKAGGLRPEALEIKQFINFIESIIPKKLNLLYSNSMFNLNKEFECALASLNAGFELIFTLEEALLISERPFILNYVITYGDIEVPRRKGMFRGIVGRGLMRAGSFIMLWDYNLIAKEMEKDPSLIWKRRKSLNIRQYNTIKELILRTPDLIIKKKPSRTNEQPPAF